MPGHTAEKKIGSVQIRVILLTPKSLSYAPGYNNLLKYEYQPKKRFHNNPTGPAFNEFLRNRR